MSQQRRVCAVCGSRRFRLIASQLVCDAGHIQRDFRIEAALDDDGFDTQITTRTRSLNRASQRDSERAEKRQRAHEQRRKIHGRTMHVIPGSVEHFSLPDPDAAHLHGPRVMFAIVQAYQLILRKQIEALCKYMGDDCPCMLEAYARDFGPCMYPTTTYPRRRWKQRETRQSDESATSGGSSPSVMTRHDVDGRGTRTKAM